MKHDLTFVVDCLGVPHLVKRADLADKRDRLICYYRSGKPIGSFPPGQRYNSVLIHRESIASVAVRLRKHTALDDRIARKCRHMVTACF